VLNLDDSSVTDAALREQFSTWRIDGLDEVLTIRDGVVSRLPLP